MNWTLYWQVLPIVLGMGVVTWTISALKKNLAIVDILWPLMFLASSIWYALSFDDLSPAQIVLLTMVLIWSLRLAGHLFVRNWNEEEDRRYAEMRASGGSNYTLKSLYKIFALQAILAWLVSMTLFTAFSTATTLNTWSYIGMALWLIGFLFESVGDYQLLSFRSQPENRGKVLNTGLWRYTRHPNYFGEFLIWWGFYCFTLPHAPLIGLLGPLMMSFFLMKFSGVPMLEKGIRERRADYAEYVAQTNTFFPGPVKNIANKEVQDA